VRIGIFGGTFDPPHVGHLLAAVDACELLALDRILFVPAAAQPLKSGQPAASAEHRIAMLERLIAADPRFGVDPIEVERGGLSFTVDTLQALRQRWPAGKAELVLLLGADAAAQFPRWKAPETIQSLAEVVVMTRGEAAEGVPAGLRSIASRRVDVSSTEVRERVRAGKSVQAFVTEPVAAYIARTGLYR
jgi:nicotinate-nucleotide adenylyltransferase